MRTELDEDQESAQNAEELLSIGDRIVVMLDVLKNTHYSSFDIDTPSVMLAYFRPIFPVRNTAAAF